MTTKPAGSDAISTLRWGIRRYLWLFLASALVVGVGLPLLALTRTVTYEAQALVVAQRLEIDLETLPRYGEAVFDNGEVARRIVSEFGAVGPFHDVVPDRVSLVADQDSIVFKVLGHDASRDMAAAMANVAAEEFTKALNAPGEDIGAFAIQSLATPPTELQLGIPVVSLVMPVGLGAGLVVGLTLVAVILVVRRPVLSTADAEAATGIPVIGRVTVPRCPPDEPPEAREITGLVAVCRQLVASRTHTVVLVGTPRSTVARRHLAVAMMSVLGQVRPVNVMGPPDLLAAAQGYRGPHVSAHPDPAAVENGRSTSTLTIVDGTYSAYIAEALRSSFVLLIVPIGTPMAELRSAAVEHLTGSESPRLLLVESARRRPKRKASTPLGASHHAGKPENGSESREARSSAAGALRAP